MKRIASFLIAMIMLLSIVPVYAQAESAMLTSDDCIEILKAEEGFSRTPYWDFTQYTVGYGTRCPSDMVDYYTQNGITEVEAETLLRNHLVAVERDINVRIIDKYGLTLTQSQFDALVLFSYNCGTSWAYETAGTFHTAIAKGATGNDLIRAFALWCSAGNQIRTYLLRRRLCEANMYLNGEYSTTPPENYSYVLYNGNGGVVSPRTQGYDAALTAQPYPVPVYTGYTFQGWYTAMSGGTKVTVLDDSTKGVTLYARWADGEGNTPDDGATEENPVTVTVTSSELNLREGPGTNYTIVKKAVRGDKFVITERASGTGYIWGKSESGWLALEYTDYDTVVNSKPDTTPEETTPPETTAPEETTPPTTAPEETTPPATEPPATNPPVTETPVKVTGKVNVQDLLRIRSGPGTSYSIVGYLGPKKQIEILEQKTVGNTVWGRISNGWVSMDYVILDKPSNSTGNTGNSGNTGSSGTTESKPAAITGTVKVQDCLRIRSGAGTSYSIVGYLGPNAKVTILEKKTVGSTVWGKISNGWISMDYVKVDGSSSGSAPAQPVTKTITADCLHVRKAAGTTNPIVGYLYYGAKVSILETTKAADGSTWGRISTGWIHMGYTK